MNKKRVGFIDEVRGFAIICMVIYHLMYDLKFIYGLNIPIFFEGWFGIIRDIFAGAFIFISGTACRYSRNNLKRGSICFFAGMIITFVTAVGFPKEVVMFGILHSLGICMMLFGLLEPFLDRIPAVIGIAMFTLLFFYTNTVQLGYIGFGELLRFDLSRDLYTAKLLFPLGFAGYGFSSSDYFPLLPWFMLFISGSFFGVLSKDNVLPNAFYKTHVPPLAIVGRHTIWIYLLHQPVIYLILELIF